MTTTVTKIAQATIESARPTIACVIGQDPDRTASPTKSTPGECMTSNTVFINGASDGMTLPHSIDAICKTIASVNTHAATGAR